MRLQFLTVGIAMLIALGIWQVRADQGAGAKAQGGAGDAALLKHGAYLVNEVAHCSHCHTPPDAKGQPDRSRLLRGATLGIVPKQKTENWADMAPDITSRGLAGKWGEAAMVKFLTIAASPHLPARP